MFAILKKFLNIVKCGVKHHNPNHMLQYPQKIKRELEGHCALSLHYYCSLEKPCTNHYKILPLVHLVKAQASIYHQVVSVIPCITNFTENNVKITDYYVA
jgi:hypothetical protein